MNQSPPACWPEMDIPNDDVAETADQFRVAANLLFDKVVTQHVVCPVLVVAAFAVELYLKALNARNVYTNLSEECGVDSWQVTAQAQKSGHNLTELYNALLPDVKQGLDEAYSQHRLKRRFSSLQAALNDYSRVFIDWRYPFEDPDKGKCDSINGLVSLANFFGEYVSGLQKQKSR